MKKNKVVEKPLICKLFRIHPKMLSCYKSTDLAKIGPKFPRGAKLEAFRMIEMSAIFVFLSQH
jgi:hypothetical protein